MSPSTCPNQNVLTACSVHGQQVAFADPGPRQLRLPNAARAQSLQPPRLPEHRRERRQVELDPRRRQGYLPQPDQRPPSLRQHGAHR